jgi:hypothetical protein
MSTDEERFCLEMLALMRKLYERDAQPYIDRLVSIKSMQPPQPMFLDPSTLSGEMLEFLKGKP